MQARIRAIAFAGAVLALLGTAAAASDDAYVNRDGQVVHRPVRASHAPAGATARCRDGSWSFSLHHRGTCSHHGGVSTWL
jgi:Protein of unknown function (DUF3761)